MTPTSERVTTPWAAGRALVVASGILLTVVLFLPWYSASTIGGAGHFSGIALSSVAPELGILPAIGIAAVIGGVVTGRVGRVLYGTMAAWAAVVVGLVGIAVPLEVAARLNGTMQTYYGEPFLNAAAIGWYVALLVSFLILCVGCVRLFMPEERFAPAPA